MTWTAYPLAENITSVLELMRYGNSVTDNLFGIALPFVIFSISLIMMYGKIKIENSIMVSGFIAWFFAMLFKTIGLVPDWIVIAFSVGVIASVIASLAHRKDVETS